MKLKGIELSGTYKVRYHATSFEVYDEKGNVIYSEGDTGYWSKNEYNEKGKRIYFEDRSGYWARWKYNELGNEIYYENSNGEIIDKRVKELTIEQIGKILGYKIKIKGDTK